MNTKILLAVLLAIYASTTFATDALLSPRAQGNQIKTVSSSVQTDGVSAAYVQSITPISQRLQAAQLKVLKGIANDQNPARECVRNMNGTPRAVTACSQSITMPGCMKLTAMK